MTTLMDYQDRGVPEPERFCLMNKDLSPEQYRSKIIETYGPPAGRDKKMDAIVNAAVLAYIIKK
jgi:hypothetical protein